jgi:hypothetical protein
VMKRLLVVARDSNSNILSLYFQDSALFISFPPVGMLESDFWKQLLVCRMEQDATDWCQIT